MSDLCTLWDHCCRDLGSVCIYLPTEGTKANDRYSYLINAIYRPVLRSLGPGKLPRAQNDLNSYLRQAKFNSSRTDV